MALFFIVASFLAAVIFLALVIAGKRSPIGQQILSYALLAALAVVVLGSLIGEALSYNGLLHG